jgi:hypothetical protein
MAKAQETQIQSGYEITVSGQYYAAQDRSKVIRVFSNEKFFLPEYSTIKTGFMWKEVKLGPNTPPVKRAVPKMEKVNSLQWASHLVQRYYLPARLAAKYPDFTRFRTCTITNTKRVTKEVSIADDLREENIPNMTLEQLRTLCTVKAMPIPLDDFADITEARAAVQDELQNLKLAEKKNKQVEPELTTETVPEEAETETVGDATITTAPVTDDELFG